MNVIIVSEMYVMIIVIKVNVNDKKCFEVMVRVIFIWMMCGLKWIIFKSFIVIKNIINVNSVILRFDYNVMLFIF